MKTKTVLLRALIASSLGMALPSAHATTAYTLDTGSLSDVEELYLLGTLQGVVNRDAPRLFLTNVFRNYGSDGANNTYANYLRDHKGFTFIRLKSLNEAVATFATMKRADGVTPLIKGMVKYEPTYYDSTQKKMIDKYYNYWIAANFAAQEDLIAVTAKILANKTPYLSESLYWYKDTMTRPWSEMFTSSVITPNGQAVTAYANQTNSIAKYRAYRSKSVMLDLSVTPKIEVVVSDLSPGGVWSLTLTMGSTVKTFESKRGILVPGLINRTTTGTFTVDLAASGLFDPMAGIANLRICPMTQGTTVTVKSIRFLDANGNDPSVPLYTPPSNVFSNLTIKRDLTVSRPYADDEESACTWSLANQRAKCHPSWISHSSDSVYFLGTLDFVVARKIYQFYQNKPLFDAAKPYPNLDILLAGLKPPGVVHGWLKEEDWSCLKMGQYGARYGGTHENSSFWQHVPLDKPNQPVPLPQVRKVPTLENKNYVNFSWASGDAVEISYALMAGFWGDKNRGQVPMTWGFNSLLAEYAPAFVEYYAKTATPNDSFWAGPSGAGYTHLSAMSPAQLELYMESARANIHKLGISPAIDHWDGSNPHKKNYEVMGSSASESPSIQLLTLLPDATKAASTFWLDSGVPVITTDRSVFSIWEGDGVSTPQSVATAIQAAAAKQPGNNPKFITCNLRFSPTFLKATSDLLPPDFVVVGMPDFIALAQDAGALAVVPFADGVGSGDSVTLSIELHNAAGTTGSAGTVSWTLPEGWTSSPTNWAHGPIVKGGNLKQLVTFTPPAGLANGTATITFRDERFSRDRQVFLTTYLDGRTVTDCQSIAGWSVSGGAAIAMERGMVKITPKTILERHDHANGKRVENNGRASYPVGDVDFDRGPILKVNIGDQNSAITRIGLTDGDGNFKECLAAAWSGVNTIDLAVVTGWRGKKNITLHIDPATRHGKFVAVRSVKLCYSKESPVAMVVESGATALLDANPYVVLNGATLLADPSQGTTAISLLTVARDSTLRTVKNFLLAVSQLNGPGNLTIHGPGVWGAGVHLLPENANDFSGKFILKDTWLQADERSLGAVPSRYLADAITLNNSSLMFKGTMAANRGITLAGGASQIVGSTIVVNSRITGVGNARCRDSTITLNNKDNDFVGDYISWSSTTIIGVDNALPHGAGKGDWVFADHHGSSTLDLNGHRLTLNGMKLAAPSVAAIIDNKSAKPATLVLGENDANGTFRGTIKNSGRGKLSLVKTGAGTLELSGSLDYTGNTTVQAGLLKITGKFILPTPSVYTTSVGENSAGSGQMIVTGTVNLNGAALALTGKGQPAGITLIDNDGTDPVLGTFRGLPERALVRFNSMSYRISYVGGTGNDVTLTRL